MGNCSIFRTSFLLALAWFYFERAGIAAETAPSQVLRPSPPAAAAKPIGTLISYAGRVRYWGKPVRGPTTIVEGSFIETEKDANCSVLLGREVVVHIGPESRLEFQAAQIAELKRAQLNFPYGKGRFLVRSLDPKRAESEQRFDLRVRSRAAVLGVRGTQFVIDSPRDVSAPQNFVAIEGKVAIDALVRKAGVEIPVPTEKATVIERGQALTVSKDEGSESEAKSASSGPRGPGESSSKSAGTPPLKAKVAPLESAEIEEIVAAVAPPSKPLLLAGQVSDALLPREEIAPGGGGVQAGARPGAKPGEGSSEKDPFDGPSPSDFNFDPTGATGMLDSINPTDLQGGIGLDPIVDQVDWVRPGSDNAELDLTIIGEKQSPPSFEPR
jgi:hypothetical protein